MCVHCKSLTLLLLLPWCCCYSVKKVGREALDNKPDGSKLPSSPAVHRSKTKRLHFQWTVSNQPYCGQLWHWEIYSHIADYQRLFKTIDDYPRLSKTIQDYPRLSKTITNYPKLTVTITTNAGYHRLLQIMKNYQRLFIANNCFEPQKSK